MINRDDMLELTESEREKNLKLCKTIPFAETNAELMRILGIQ